MGMLVEGKWLEDDAARRNDSSGAFVRPDSAFRSRITADGASGFPAQPGRYHLFVAYNCPWAHRTLIVRKLKKLDDAISVSRSDGPRVEGWTFSEGVDDIQPKSGFMPLHVVYTTADPAYTGRVTVPTLWDRQKRTIVNNESSEIIRMLNAEFSKWADNAIDLYPERLRGEIDEINAFVYQNVNNGVYRCGFAKSQAAYEEAFARLFGALDTLEEKLSKQRYLVGGVLTEADVRLYVTLVRFDSVYYSLFKCNRQRIEDFPALSNYLRDLYQRPGFGETTDLADIKRGYYSNASVNPTGIVPVGPRVDYTRPHDRAGLR